jgi:hypothetical protein
LQGRFHSAFDLALRSFCEKGNGVTVVLDRIGRLAFRLGAWRPKGERAYETFNIYRESRVHTGNNR